MADPVKYSIGYSFSGWQTSKPNRPLPAKSLDGELAEIARASSEAVDAINSVRRADGNLQNAVVSWDGLRTDVKELITGSSNGVTVGDISPASFATQIEAEVGVANDSIMTPLRTKEAVVSFVSSGFLNEFSALRDMSAQIETKIPDGEGAISLYHLGAQPARVAPLQIEGHKDFLTMAGMPLWRESLFGVNTNVGIVHLRDGDAIGTPNAGANLIIEDDGGIAGLQFLSTGLNSIYFGDAADDSDGRIEYNHTSREMEFQVNGANRVRIGNGGVLNALDGLSVTGDATASGNLEGVDVVASGDVSGVNVVASGNVSGVDLVASGNVSGVDLVASGDVSGDTVTVDTLLHVEPGAEPGSPVEGDIYMDSTTHKLRCYDGTIWNDLF